MNNHKTSISIVQLNNFWSQHYNCFWIARCTLQHWLGIHHLFLLIHLLPASRTFNDLKKLLKTSDQNWLHFPSDIKCLKQHEGTRTIYTLHFLISCVFIIDKLFLTLSESYKFYMDLILSEYKYIQIFRQIFIVLTVN